jgi:YcxB-like protein
MTVRYMLTWEEFMEVHASSLPRPSIGSFICMVLIAIASGSFGGLLIYFIEPQDRMIASVFCWISLAVLVAAFWDLTFRTSKRRQQFTREMRSIYDRYYDGEQAFWFDDHKWTHETKAGKYEASWSALTTSAERPNVIHWSTKDHSIVLPKRVIAAMPRSDCGARDEKATLAQLHGLALGPLNNGSSFRLGIVDYLLIEIPSLWRRHPFLMAEAHLGGLFWVLVIANGMYNSVGPGVVFGWVIASVLLFLTITGQLWYFMTKYFTAPPDLRNAWQSGFSDRGVRTRSSEVELFSAWMTFRKFKETSRAFLLHIDPTHYHIYPKRCLSSDGQTNLRNLLKASVAADS